jgi:hypothetical protein
MTAGSNSISLVANGPWRQVRMPERTPYSGRPFADLPVMRRQQCNSVQIGPETGDLNTGNDTLAEESQLNLHIRSLFFIFSLTLYKRAFYCWGAQITDFCW